MRKEVSKDQVKNLLLGLRTQVLYDIDNFCMYESVPCLEKEKGKKYENVFYWKNNMSQIDKMILVLQKHHDKFTDQEVTDLLMPCMTAVYATLNTWHKHNEDEVGSVGEMPVKQKEFLHTFEGLFKFLMVRKLWWKTSMACFRFWQEFDKYYQFEDEVMAAHFLGIGIHQFKLKEDDMRNM